MRMERRLGREDWLQEGLRLLAAKGWRGFAVEPAARALGVTKGSFYWHFRDRDDWRDAVLAYWEHRAFAALVRRGGVSGPEVALERALADWAGRDVAAARTMARVLAERRRAGAGTVQARAA